MGLNSWTELPNIKIFMPSLKVRPTPNGAPCVTGRFALFRAYGTPLPASPALLPTDNPVKNFNYYEDVSQNHEIICGVIRPGCWHAISQTVLQIPLVSKHYRSAKRRRSERSPVHLFETMGQIQAKIPTEVRSPIAANLNWLKRVLSPLPC